MEVLHIEDIKTVFFYNKQQPYIDKRHAGIDFDQLEARIRSGHRDCKHVTIVTQNNKRVHLNKRQACVLFKNGVVKF